MAYIYKIVNDLNNKIYIGKTLDSIDKRFQKHISDSRKERCEKRPLYNAINKYGIEHFHIEQIEECSESEVDEREKYWIEHYGSFKYGYNATIGGDGKRYADYDLIYSLWNEGKNGIQIQEILGYDKHTIKVALDNMGVCWQERKQRNIDACKHSVAMLDKHTGEIINIFPSVQAACNFLNKHQSGHISEVCLGKRKTCYGYKWKYC